MPKACFYARRVVGVITIIAILIALLLPAVQAAREAARRMQCTTTSNSLRWHAWAMKTSPADFRPTVGDTAGRRRRPRNRLAPAGGWIYNILPFIEQQDLHDLVSEWGVERHEQKAANGQRLVTLLTGLICPTRRPAVLYRGWQLCERHSCRGDCGKDRLRHQRRRYLYPTSLEPVVG